MTPAQQKAIIEATRQIQAKAESLRVANERLARIERAKVS